jgi:hypothetical protein
MHEKLTILFIFSGRGGDTFKVSWAVADKLKRARPEKRNKTADMEAVDFFMADELI